MVCFAASGTNAAKARTQQGSDIETLVQRQSCSAELQPPDWYVIIISTTCTYIVYSDRCGTMVLQAFFFVH